MGASTQRVVSETEFPATGSGREKLGFAVRRAMLATRHELGRSVEFVVREQLVELMARNPGSAAVVDPEGRDAMIQCGVTLQHLKLTLKRHGCFGRIELFPDLDQPQLAARVHLGRTEARDDFERLLFKAVEPGENLHRLPVPISGAALDWLLRASTRERSWLEIARCEGSRQRLRGLMRAPRGIRATEIQVQDEAMVRSTDGRWKLARLTGGMLQERLARWRRPVQAIKVHPTMTPSYPLPESERPPSDGTLAVLKTKTDDKHGWLATGQTLAGLLLHARRLGLACTPFLDALRQPELRAELRTALGHKGFTQVILCFTGPPPEMQASATVMYSATETRSST